MARQFNIAGQSLVQVIGPAGSLFPGTWGPPVGPGLAGGAQLGLSVDPIEVTVLINSEPVIVDAYGKNNPIDEQVYGGEAMMRMNLVHFDPVFLGEVVRLSLGGTAEGLLGTAGHLRGNNSVLGSSTNRLMCLSITSPLGNFLPYTFHAAYLKDQPIRFPFGAERTIVQLEWRALAYTIDPWNGGAGSLGAPLYSRIGTTFAPPNPT